MENMNFSVDNMPPKEKVWTHFGKMLLTVNGLCVYGRFLCSYRTTGNKAPKCCF
jgi:hypothetical protein